MFKKIPEEKKLSELEKTKDNLPIITLNEYESVNCSYDDSTIDIKSNEENKLSDYDINVSRIIDNGQKKLHVDVGGYVGAVSLSNFIINVEPKFKNIKSLGRLIHYTSGFDDITFPDEKINFLEMQNHTLYFHIELLIRYVEIILKEGLYKNYITIQEDSPYLKGKLLLLPTEKTFGQILNDSRFNLQFSCEHDEFSANTLENQILLYTLEYCQRESPAFHQKMKIQRLIHEIDSEVEIPNSITRNEFHQLHYTSINQRYKNALHCCQIILDGFGFESLREQKTEFIHPFFIKMDVLFQDFIARLLKNMNYFIKADLFRDFASTKRKRETEKVAWEIKGTDKKKNIRPDIIMYRDNTLLDITTIIDAKYKDDEEDRWLAESDMYQIAFYLDYYKIKTGFAILPKHENSKDDYEIEAVKQGLEIRVRHIDVEDTLKWIFNKNTDNQIIKNMLNEKLDL